MHGPLSDSVNGEIMEALCSKKCSGSFLNLILTLNRKGLHDSHCVCGETEVRTVLFLKSSCVECLWWPGPWEGLTCIFSVGLPINPGMKILVLEL